MKKFLNTLFVTSEDAFLSLEGETVCVKIDQQKVGQFPLHTLENIVCFSYRGASPALMGECAQRGIDFSFFTPNGRFLCRITGESKGNVLLRKQQYRISDQKSDSCEVARNFILGKVFNCRWCIDRTLRDHEMRVDSEKLKDAISLLTQRMKQIKEENDLDSLRGLEGECATIYFSVFDELILNQKNIFCFHERSKRPPLDPLNALLSFGYSLLANDCAGALEGVGLDSYVGFMHRDNPGRESLALDLMEELRAVLVDRFVLTLINSRQVGEDHFQVSQSGAVLLTEEGRRKFLTKWQEHKKEQITHPFLKEKICWGLVPYIQALLLARYIRGDLDGYPPFLWK